MNVTESYLTRTGMGILILETSDGRKVTLTLGQWEDLVADVEEHKVELQAKALRLDSAAE